MDLSIIIPLYNEEESLQELTSWITRVLSSHSVSYEIIFVDDGSNDKSWYLIEAISSADERIKGIRFRRNYGKSAALNVGFRAAKGDVVLTMDADLQDSPDEIPALYSMIKNEGYDLVSGYKKTRHDPVSKTIPSKLFNWTTRKMSGIYSLHDFNCGLKAYRNDVVKSVEIYGEMHRYIPVIVYGAGFTRISEKVVTHHPRKYGKTKFGLERFINGFLDLLSILFVSKFGKKPMHIFGLLGTLSFIAGLIITLYLAITKYIFNVYGMTDRPLFYFALFFMIIGVQLFLAGFLAEMIARTSPDRNSYLVEKTIGVNDLSIQFS